MSGRPRPHRRGPWCPGSRIGQQTDSKHTTRIDRSPTVADIRGEITRRIGTLRVTRQRELRTRTSLCNILEHPRGPRHRVRLTVRVGMAVVERTRHVGSVYTSTASP